jgi:hypothetical protein
MLLFLDSYDHYSTPALFEKWTQAGLDAGTADGAGGNAYAIAAVGRNGTNGFRIRAGTSGQRQSGPHLTVAATGATAIWQFGFKSAIAFNVLLIGTTPGSDADLGGIRLSGTWQVWFRINANGTVSCYRDSTLLGTTTIALQQNVYALLEFKVLLHSSTGTVTIRINGAEALALTGQNTQGGASAAWDEFVTPSVEGVALAEWYWDDTIIMDGAGTAYNDLLGDNRVLACFVNGEGAHTDGTPSSGADRALMVDEVSADGDTTYNTKATTNQRDSFTIAGWPSAGLIGAIQLVGQARKDDEGSAEIALGVRVDGVDHDGTAQGLSTDYAMKRQIFEEDPENAAPWAAGSPPELIDLKAT